MEQEGRALLTVEGESGGKGAVIVPEDLVLGSVRQLRELTDSPIVISEVETSTESSRQ